MEVAAAVPIPISTRCFVTGAARREPKLTERGRMSLALISARHRNGLLLKHLFERINLSAGWWDMAGKSAKTTYLLCARRSLAVGIPRRGEPPQSHHAWTFDRSR
jgi:hypothetical protein